MISQELETNVFENDSFKVEVKEHPGCRVSSKVEISKEQSQKAYKQAIKRINKEISVPGFRKGKAPDQTVLQKFGSYVEKEWKEILMQEALSATLELAKVYPLNKESIQKPNIERSSLEESSLIHINFERYPNVPEIDFSDLSLPTVENAPISDEKIEDVVDEIQRSWADWEEVTGRPVEEGDYVDISIDAIDQDPPKSIVKERRFEVTDKRLGAWLKNLLIGLSVGESAEGMSELDENAEDSVKNRFKPTRCRVMLHAIKKIILPPVDEALAKKSGASSVEDLMKRIQENLEKEAEEEQKQKQLLSLDDALLEKYPIEIPQSILNAEKRERKKEKIQDLRSRQLSKEEIQAQDDALEDEALREAERNIRLYFLEKQIIQQGKIAVTTQELNDEIVRHVSQNPQFYQKDINKETQREVVSRLANGLLHRKAKEFALEQISNK